MSIAATTALERASGPMADSATGFASDGETTYRVMRLHLLGEKPKDVEVAGLRHHAATKTAATVRQASHQLSADYVAAMKEVARLRPQELDSRKCSLSRRTGRGPREAAKKKKRI
jgi:hypothetical protein